MRVTYSPEVQAIIRKRQRRALAASRSVGWIAVYLAILVIWMVLP